MSDGPPQSARIDVTFREALRVWTKIGLLSFGGPAAQIATMHRILVDEKKWVSEERFLHALNYCMLLPGPEATQLVTYVGWLLHGLRGGLAAGLLFILPGFVALMALSLIYVVYHDVAWIAAMFWGLQAAVLAIVLEAVHRIGKRALRRGWGWIVAGSAFVLLFFFAVPFPALILAAAIVGIIGGHFRPELFGFKAPSDSGNGSTAEAASVHLRIRPTWRAMLATTLAWLAVWFLPVMALWIWLGRDHVLVKQGVFFSKASVMTFGGAYAVLPYVAQQAVERFGWLSADQMMVGLSMAETTPGPLIMVLQFVGFMGAYSAAEHGATLGGLAVTPIAMGVCGAVVSVWTTFVPCFLWIFVGAPYIETLRGLRWLNTAMAAITAAVVGVILNLAVWFALHTLFRSVSEQRVGPAGVLRLYVPEWATIDWLAAALATTAAVLLVRFKIGLGYTLLVCTIAGMAWRGAF